ncbi:MAG TPA: SDR family NAD(P)-dependent oxidoreductase [Egibacteraceae bacterium]|nr:SDR family NAD(P)-dependent oxidoreductase [Egibacteraceae bacterium]
MQRVYEHERPRTALVAGGTGALGGAVVEVLLGRGERLCVPWVDEQQADRLRTAHADALAEGQLRLSRCDVADADQVAALLDVLGADWGPLWLACSTVGGWAGGETVEQLAHVTLLDRMVLLNLRTATVVAREGLRHMGPAGGRVVLVGSRTALHPVAGQAAYNAAKAGLLALVATLAQELRGSGRTANAVVPKVIDTPANRRAMPDADHRRWVPPRAIAKVIAWLASAESWPVSGAAIPVYGDS